MFRADPFQQALNVLYGRQKRQEWNKGLEMLQELCAQTHLEAMQLFGCLLWDGIGIPPDRAVATRLLQRCSLPIARIMCRLLGLGVVSNPQAAFEYLQGLEETADPHLDFLRGLFRDLGAGCDPDPQLAAEFFQRASDQGHIGAAQNLAYLYANGVGVTENHTKAIALYARAAEQGYDAAQLELAHYYALGQHVKQDLALAAMLYHRAAQQGNAEAMCCFGNCFELGEGVALDFAQAVDWFARAALQTDNADAREEAIQRMELLRGDLARRGHRTAQLDEHTRQQLVQRIETTLQAARMT
eukprot:TRINITY_DN15339_c0_g1_i1.p1 TRINITY_DN15339_c0_g1~~TRINITY_DN15339_c0_g1_i1.p1  ORF type:complete len:300 (+),score=61.54 TRINITY_DN15339_c0_g1_i1:89-988(+)